MEQQNQIGMDQNQLRAVAQRQRAPYAIFRAVHAAMGRALAEHAEALGIRKTARESSENIKGYDSENQGWEK